MMGKRWGWITLALLVAWTGVASAQPVVSMTPNTIDAGSIRLGMNGSANGQLHDATNPGANVDVVMTTCGITTGMGMFTLTSSTGSLTNINLNSDKTITAQYT